MLIEGPIRAAVRDRARAHRSVTEPVTEPIPQPPPSSSASGSTSKRTSPTEKVPLTADVNGAFTPSTVGEKSAPPTGSNSTTLLPAHHPEHGAGVSTGKAKKVMDWFRKRSLAKSENSVFVPVNPPADPVPSSSSRDDPVTPTMDTYRAKGGESSTSVNAPQVVITAAEGGHGVGVGGQGQIPSGWGQSPRSASGQSHASTDTSVSLQSGPKPQVASTSGSSYVPPVAKRAAEALANVAFRNPPAVAATRAFNKALLRVHHGAVDQATITSGPPPEVFEHITKVLISMGIEIQRESEYKYRCIRHKKRKTGSIIVGGGGKEGNGTLSAVSVSGSAASNGVSRFVSFVGGSRVDVVGGVG